MRSGKAHIVRLLIAAALLVAPGLTGTAWAAVRLEAKPGLDGRIKPGAWAQLIVEMQNEGADLSGELVLDHAARWDGSQFKVRYTLPVELAAGARKRFVLYAPTDYAGYSPEVRLLVRGQEVARDTAVLNHSDDILVGLLGPDREDVAALATVVAGGRRTHLIKLDPGTLPDRVAVLQNLDALIIGNFSAAELTAEQRQAIQDYVHQGGALFLIGGPEAHRTLSPWLPWLPLRLEGQAQADLAALGALAGEPLAAAGAVSRAVPAEGEVLAAAGETPLVVTWRRGKGTLTYLAFDPTLEPVHSWGGATELWARLLEPVVAPRTGRPFADNRFAVWSNLAQAAKVLPADGLPSLAGLRNLLIAYVLLVGPVTFLVLRRLRRAEWAWFTTPVLVVLLTGGIWLQGRTGLASRLAGHQVTLVELDGAGGGRALTLFGMFLPAGRAAEVHFDPAVSLVEAVPTEQQRTGDGADATVEVGGGGTGPVRFQPLGIWNMRAVGSQVPLSGMGRLDARVEVREGGTVTATVRNHTPVPLRDVYVFSGTHFIRVGDLAPGQTGTGTSAQSPGNLWHPNLADEVLHGAYGTRYWGRLPLWEDIERLRRMALIDALIQQGVDLSRPLVTGWAEWTPVSPVVNGRPFRPYSLALFVQPAPPVTASGQADVPAGLVLGRPVAWESEVRIYGPGGWGIPEQGFVTVEFDPPAGLSEVHRLGVHVPVYDNVPSRFAGAIWNWEAGRWDDLTFSANEAAVADPRPYVQPGKPVRVRLSHRSGQPAPSGIPSLVLSGRGG